MKIAPLRFFCLIHLDLAPRNCRSAATVRVTRHHRYLIAFCQEIPMEVSQNGVPPNHPKLDHDVSMETHGDLGIHHDLRNLPMAFDGTFTGKPFLFTSDVGFPVYVFIIRFWESQ